MKYYFLLLPLFFLKPLSTVQAQIVVDRSNVPIPYVDILNSSNKSVYWQTDFNGKIPLGALINMQTNDTLVLRHIAYNSRNLTKKDVVNLDTIKLEATQYKLKEVAISEKLPKYQEIKACFRHSVFQNGTPVYYSDGKVDYISKNKNIKYKLFRPSYRVFENKKIDEYLNDYNTSIPINKAYTPILEEEYLPHALAKKYKLIFKTENRSTISLLTADSVQLGQITVKGNQIEYQFNNIFEFKKRKALNTEVETKHYFIYMIFRKIDHQKPLETLKNYNELLYYKFNYGQSFKHDKDQKIRDMKNIEEIFIEHVSFTNFKGDDYSNQRGMPNKSYFDNTFWENCDCKLYFEQDSSFFELLKML